MKKFYHMFFEISMGIDRSLYTILEHSLKNDEEHERMVLSLKTIFITSSCWNFIIS